MCIYSRARENERGRAKLKAFEKRVAGYFGDPADWVCSLQSEEEYGAADAIFVGVFGMKTFDQVFGVVGKDSGEKAAVDATFDQERPILAMMVTATPMIQGKRRKTATLTMIAEDGMWKAGLRDRDRNVSLWVSASTFLGALDALETALNGDTVPWRRMDTAWESRARK